MHTWRFLSTLSLRRATETTLYRVVETQISIHALLAESDNAHLETRQPCAISIHALLAESDSRAEAISTEVSDFYPRSPCGERLRGEHHANSQQEFLSTLSLRRATNCTSIGRPKRLYFYPRSPCGERLNEIPYQRQINQFLSTLSLRRATH